MKAFLWLFLGVMASYGEDFTLQVEGVRQEILVTLPDNHDSSRTWPAVLHYHGTGGRPNTDLIRSHTGRKDWIVVGMGYVREGQFQLTPEGLDAEIRVLEEVRAQLQTRINLDPSRTYVSGFSKGGWVSGLLLQKERSLAGAVILGAGHLHQLQTPSPPFANKKAVFIGVGRYDGNYPLSLKAAVFFRGLGANSVMEAWQGIGHRFPREGSKGLKEWFALQVGNGPLENEMEKELNQILASEDKFQKWWALLEFAQRPAILALPGWPEKVDSYRLELEKSPELAREVRILKESRRLLAKELTKKTLADFEAIAAGYARIVEHAGNSPQRETAAQDEKRFGEILELARAQISKEKRERQRREVEIKPETEKRRIPRNPLVR